MADLLVLPRFLSPAEQQRIIELTFAISPGFYTPRTRWGQAMNVRMNCLGQHWSARNYKYSPIRIDVDGLPSAPIPDELQAMARRAVVDTGYLAESAYRPFDICIVNLYAEATGKMGDHVDNSESPEALASGYPVVSLSVGASCIFRIGGEKRTDPYEKYTLESGDLVVFGGKRRLAYHGVRKILSQTVPEYLHLDEPLRCNLTFRVL